MRNSNNIVVLLAVVATVLLLPVQAAFPPYEQWCPLKDCPQPAKSDVDAVLVAEKAMFGNAGAKCGDGVCNIVAGETCATCAQDCGPCSQKKVIVRCQNPKHVAITFDDGPSQYSDDLLAVLKKLDITATMFVNGIHMLGGGSYAAATRRAFEAGHTIGTHTFTHRSLVDGHVGDSTKLPKMTPDNVRLEMLYNDLAIFATIGRAPRFLRPPYLDVAPDAMAQLETMGYLPISINVDSQDWQMEANKSTADLVRHYKQEIDNPEFGQPGFISLQHELYDYSIRGVPEIAAYVRGKGLEFVPMHVCLDLPETAAYRQPGDNPFLRQSSAKGLTVAGPANLIINGAGAKQSVGLSAQAANSTNATTTTTAAAAAATTLSTIAKPTAAAATQTPASGSSPSLASHVSVALVSVALFAALL
ncbi:hypothetical protein RI367_000312 [Sorochytrium milnesiophthora]